MKKILISLVAIIYFVALIQVNDLFGDIFSPILTFMLFYFVFDGFVLKESNRGLKIVGIFNALGIFTWFLCDFMWGIYNLVLHLNPEDNLIITYGYSATCVCFFISSIILLCIELRKWNKMQLFLDTAIITICIMVLIWLFVFEENKERIHILNSDVIFMVSMILDTIVYSLINIWFFSMVKRKVPLYKKFVLAGYVLFVLSDLVYYYQYFYSSYEPNSLIDGAYVIAFGMMAVGGYLKTREETNLGYRIEKSSKNFEYSKEILILVVPVILYVFKRNEIQYFIFVVVSIMGYYILSNYINKNIFRDELLKREQAYVTELEEQVEERTKALVKALNYDVITGLYNRRYFEENLAKACEFVDKDEQVVLLYIDQNKYKSVISIYGKFIAESLLRQVGKKIKNVVSENQGFLASYGEDVFVVMLKGFYSYDHGLSIADNIIEKCSGMYTVEKNDIFVTFNMGISCYPIDAKNHEELVKNADSAMINARKIGFNKSLPYNTNIGQQVYNKNKIEMRLKKVNFDEEFLLFYQPQVGCKSEELVGFELLIRWFTKSGKYIPPNEFIPIAEENGLIVPLGYWIIEKAAMQFQEWKSNCTKEFRFAINVSIKQLNDNDFVSKFLNILDKYHVPYEAIEIEITENISLEKSREIIDSLKLLRDKGLTVAIDDFGTGYSSLYYLKNIPLDRIKIAKELIDNIENDAYSRTIIQLVIEIARTSGISVIAEGVETKEQLQCLRDLKCDEIQGYYFAKPMSCEDAYQKWLL